jgi:hypothetical protein
MPVTTCSISRTVAALPKTYTSSHCSKAWMGSRIRHRLDEAEAMLEPLIAL